MGNTAAHMQEGRLWQSHAAADARVLEIHLARWQHQSVAVERGRLPRRGLLLEAADGTCHIGECAGRLRHVLGEAWLKIGLRVTWLAIEVLAGGDDGEDEVSAVLALELLPCLDLTLILAAVEHELDHHLGDRRCRLSLVVRVA